VARREQRQARARRRASPQRHRRRGAVCNSMLVLATAFFLVCATPATPSETDCSDDRSCPENRICVDGACRPLDSCEVDEDCPPGQFCRQSSCHPECHRRNCVCAHDGTCLYGLDCTSVAECGGGQICVRGFCRDEVWPGAGSGLGTGVAAECTDDSDCPGSSCGTDGRCVLACDRARYARSIEPFMLLTCPA
jgi:hypothetical protein